VPREDLLSIAAALTGFFLWNSLQPPPPHLPTLRKVQRDQGEVMVRFLAAQHL